ncbi:MAG: pectin acetylesterase-family hydrolase [Actinomycetota bacterium]
MISRRWILAVFTVLALVAAACGDDDDSSGSSESTQDDDSTRSADGAATDDETATTTTEAPAETTTTTEPPAPEPEWVNHLAGDDCMCADGSEYWYHTREADPDKVVLYFQGGGACFTAGMCDFENGSYKVTTAEDDHPDGDANGIFDFDNPLNPLADWTFVFVPYCSGDVFLGDATTDYGEDLTVEHNGFANAMHGLDYVVENYADASQLLVTGSSAGGVPAPLFGGLASDRMSPDTDIAVLADASGGYASNPVQNQFIGNLWGSTNNIPDWPTVADIEPAEWGIPDLFRFAGVHDPDIRMARFDNAFDEVQESFSALAGLDGGLLEVLDVNEALVEADGVDLDIYVAPGEGHTILGRPIVYDTVVEGVAFLDWLTTFVNGDSPGDVRCTECGAPDADEGDDG